jgi:hypothetical protein
MLATETISIKGHHEGKYKFPKDKWCVWDVCVYVNTFRQFILPKYMLAAETISIKGHNEGKYRFWKDR